MSTRIVIDTDDLRTVAQHLNGALDQLATIRTALSTVGVDIDDVSDFSARRFQMLSGIETFGATLTQDHNELVREILEIEELEGPPPAVTTQPSHEWDRVSRIDRTDRKLGILAALGVLFASPEGPKDDSSDAPQPWDEQWVNPDGSVPPGKSTAGSGGYSASVSTSVGTAWDERADFGDERVGGSARVSGEAEAWAYGEAHAGKAADGGYEASAAVGTGARAESHVEAEAHAGPAHAKGSADASAEVSAKAEAEGHIGPEGISGSASAEAKAQARASAEGEVGVDGLGSLKGTVDAEAGAEAWAHASGSIGSDGVSGELGAGGFAGASAGTEFEAEIGGSKASGRVEGRVGVGLEVGVRGGISSKGVKLGLDLGAALGIGGKISIDVEISWDTLNPVNAVKGAFNTAKDVFEGIKGLFSSSSSSASSKELDDAVKAGREAMEELGVEPPPGAEVGAGVQWGLESAQEAVPDGSSGAWAGVSVEPPPYAEAGAGVQAGAGVRGSADTPPDVGPEEVPGGAWAGSELGEPVDTDIATLPVPEPVDTDIATPPVPEPVDTDIATPPVPETPPTGDAGVQVQPEPTPPTSQAGASVGGVASHSAGASMPAPQSRPPATAPPATAPGATDVVADALAASSGVFESTPTPTAPTGSPPTDLAGKLAAAAGAGALAAGAVVAGAGALRSRTDRARTEPSPIAEHVTPPEHAAPLPAELAQLLVEPPQWTGELEDASSTVIDLALDQIFPPEM